MIGRIAIAQILAVAFLQGDARTEIRLADLNVVAVDSRGQPVTDLARDEFQVVDAGKRQQIAFFRHDDGKLPRTPTLGPNEFSNRGSAGNPHATLILFDLLNERFDTRGFSENQIVHDLEDLETADNLYLYLLTVDGRLFAVHGIPEAWEGPHRQDPIPWTRRIKSLMDDAMRAVFRTRPIDIDVNVRIALTFNALETIAAQLSGFPGRKNVVWITDGIPIALSPERSGTLDAQDFTPQLRQLSEWFDRCGAAIYPVRQVMLGSPDSMGADWGGSGAGSADTLDTLAGLTGGRPTGSKDVGAAVRQAMRDVRSSYQIGYYPPPQNWDGKFHALRVTCTRRGVRIQARTGYYAWPEPAGARAERAIGSAIPEEFDAAEIGLRGMVTPDPDNGRHVHLTLRIDANNIALAQHGDRYSAQLRLAFVDYQRNGRTTRSTTIPLDLDYSAGQRDKALKEGIDFAQGVTLDEGADRLRVVVFDRGSNTTGSLTIPVDETARKSADTKTTSP